MSLADVIDRDVALLGLLIHEHRVPVRERTAAAVLPGETDVGSLGTQCADRQRFGGRPIDAVTGFDRGALRFQLSGDLAVEVKAIRNRDEAMPNLAQ